MKQFKRYAPIVISVILLLVLAGYAPWPKVWRTFQHIPAQIIVSLILLSWTYYGLKVVRFWYMLKAIEVRLPLWVVALSYMSAQPVSLLPAGEVFRSHSLERLTGTPVAKTLPQFTVQGLLEGSALAAVGIIAALAIGELRVPILALSVVAATALVAVQRGSLAPALKQINRIPFISLNASRIQQFSRSNQAMLAYQRLPFLLSISIVTELVGGAIAYLAVTGVGGHLSGFEAILVYVLPIVVGFLSLLPGGLGAAEQSAIGILLLSDTGVAIAVAGTLIMRVTIVGSGVLYGLVAILITRVVEPKMMAKRA